MSFRNSDHFTDRFFRKKLKDVDLGNQDHLWKGIESALNEDKSSRRVLSFPWMLKSVLVLSLISFSLLASYRYFNNNSSNLNEDGKNGNRVTSGIVADNSVHSIQNNQSVENSDSRISNVNEVVSDNKTYNKAIDNSENPNNVTHNTETSKQKDGASIINDFSEPISNDAVVNVGFQRITCIGSAPVARSGIVLCLLIDKRTGCHSSKSGWTTVSFMKNDPLIVAINCALVLLVTKIHAISRLKRN